MFQAPSLNIVRDILLKSLKSQNFQRAITPKIDRNCLKVNQVINASSSISLPSFKPLAQKPFEISCWQDFVLIFQRGIAPEREITRTRKKYGSAIFPWGIHIWNFKPLACMVHKIWHASKSVTNGHTDWCTNNPKPINPSNFFEVGGIKNKKMINRSVCCSVMSVFKTSERKRHFWSHVEAKTIMKRLFSHQNKEKTKQLLKTFEYAMRNRLTNVERSLTYSPCFYIIILKWASPDRNRPYDICNRILAFYYSW